jgi:prevent-host-death family protein
MSTQTWTVAEAKAKFSEIAEKARVSGPQAVTKNGRTAVVVVSAEAWERKTHRPGNPAAFFAESPFRGSGLKAARKRLLIPACRSAAWKKLQYRVWSYGWGSETR